MMRLSIDLRLNLPSMPCVPKPMSSGSQRSAGMQHMLIVVCVTVRLRVPGWYQDL